MSLRVSGLYFAITTFIFTLVLTVLATDLQRSPAAAGPARPGLPRFPAERSSRSGTPVAWCVMLALLLCIALVWNIRGRRSTRSCCRSATRSLSPRRRAFALAGEDRRVRTVGRDGRRRRLALLLPWRRLAGPIRLVGVAEHPGDGAGRRHQHHARTGDRRRLRLDVSQPRQYQSLAAGDALRRAVDPRRDLLPGGVGRGRQAPRLAMGIAAAEAHASRRARPLVASAAADRRQALARGERRASRRRGRR